MRSRKEQLQAYQFLRRRIGAALLSGEPDTLDPPMRRVVRTSFAGIMVGAIVVAVFGLYGVFRPGGNEGWKVEKGALIIEKETGAAYVYYQGKLHPMLNYASARLYLGQGDLEPDKVSRGSLEGTPRAPEKGIPGAPHSLPDPKDLVVEPWTVCADPNSPSSSEVTLLAGVAPDGGELASNEGLVVSAGDQTYLVWRNTRYLVPDPRILNPLGFNNTSAQEVGVAWLNALPEGPELVYPQIPGLGQPGPNLAGRQTTIGEVYFVDYGDRQQFVLVMPDGLAPITKAVSDVIRSDPAVANALGGRADASPLGLDDYAQAPRANPPGDVARYPEGVTRPANTDQAQRGVLCVTMTGTGTGNPKPTVSAVARVPHQGRAVNRPPGVPVPMADTFYVDAGRGAIVGAVPAPNMPAAVQPNSRFVVTDRGVKFPIANDGALEALGYADAEVARLPVSFLQMLPSGPTLNRRDASRPAVDDVPEQAPGQQTGRQQP